VKALEESAAKRREPHEALLEVEELYMLYEDEVKHAELALEGLEEPSVSTVEAEKEAELTRIVGPEGSVDLVLVVEVSHWFDLENFYNNVRRVLCKSGGVIAVSVYPARPKGTPSEQGAERVLRRHRASLGSAGVSLRRSEAWLREAPLPVCAGKCNHCGCEPRGVSGGEGTEGCNGGN
jgi:SAM-dependent methyltransferase